MPRYFDAHQHFHFEALTPHRAAIDADLRALGLRRAVVNATGEEEWPRVAELARQFGWILPSYGVHPWDCGNRSAGWLAALRAQLAADPSAGVGEIGLDRWIVDGVRPDDPRLAGLRVAPIDEQSEVLAAQLKLAAEFNRPASIHCTQAFGRLHEILCAGPLPARGFLLHGYGGPADLIDAFTRLGAFFSFNVEVLRHAGREHPLDEPVAAAGASRPVRPTRLEVWKQVPADRLLVETDAPATPPPPERNRFPLGVSADGAVINHPANIAAAYAALAELRALPLEALAAQVERNFAVLFL